MFFVTEGKYLFVCVCVYARVHLVHGCVIVYVLRVGDCLA